KYGIATGYTGGIGSPRLGHLTMDPGTTLRLNDDGSGIAEFASITTRGATAAIQGGVTLSGPMTLGASPGTLYVTGSFTMADGSTYHWEHDTVNQDLVAVTGTVDVSSTWTLGISLGGVLPDGQYNLFTHTGGSAPPVGAVNIVKENAYASLITTATVGSDASRVFVTLDLADVTTWTSNSGSGGTTAWNVASNWNSGAGPVPTTAIPAIVQAPTANQVATVTALMGPQAAQSLIIDNNGHVLVEKGGSLHVDNDAYVEPTGRLTVNGSLSVGHTVTTGIPTPPALLVGLIGRWPFAEGSGTTTADASGGGNNGTINAGATWVNDATRGWVLNFPAAGSVSIPTAAFASLAGSPQVTISLWQYGDAAAQPRSDTIFGGWNGGSRIVQSHIPWGDSVVYWDAGDTGGYDRINKGAATSEFEGQWNNWTFVKNATTNTMQIYLNGALWHSGGGTRTLSPITAFYIGSNGAGAENYAGMMDDFVVWNRALSAVDILDLYQTGFGYTTTTLVGGT
ncbi:MAG: LamG domain-containing protein, partial [Gemmatimonadetes bacterium]|nr:LamG domain-containing protein [Gemmatimonadota bacterium]